MEMLKVGPCGDHSCTQRSTPLKGMGTNGGCRCALNVESAVFDLVAASKELEKIVEEADLRPDC
jgi:hypothetical protein